MNKKKITIPTPRTRQVSHEDVLRAVRNCYLATSQFSAKKVEYDGCVHEEKQRDKCYGELFSLLFKRRPTPDELYYMIGGAIPTCTKCNKEIVPNNNGTMNVICPCEKEDLSGRP